MNSSLMLVTALSPVIGYDKASRIAHYALDNDLTLKQAALKLGFVTETEFERIVDPAKMVRPYVAKGGSESAAPIQDKQTNIKPRTQRDAKNDMPKNKVGIECLRDPSLNRVNRIHRSREGGPRNRRARTDVTEAEDLQLSL